MITPEQIRAARELLGWSQSTLAKRARRAVCTVNRAETRTLHPTLVASVTKSIKRALEVAGLEVTSGSEPRLTVRAEP